MWIFCIQAVENSAIRDPGFICPDNFALENWYLLTFNDKPLTKRDSSIEIVFLKTLKTIRGLYAWKRCFIKDWCTHDFGVAVRSFTFLTDVLGLSITVAFTRINRNSTLKVLEKCEKRLENVGGMYCDRFLCTLVHFFLEFIVFKSSKMTRTSHFLRY